MKTKIITLILSITFTFYTLTLFADSSIEAGKAIFTTRCTSCHNVNVQVVGPALANVDQRRTLEWIVNFVHSPKTLIEKKDEQAAALYNQFNQIVMPDHQDLSTDDIKDVLTYIKSETKKAATIEAPFVKPGKIIPNYHPLSITKDYAFFISYLLAVGVLTGLLIFAVHVKDLQRNRN